VLNTKLSIIYRERERERERERDSYYEIIGISEWEIYAIIAYDAIHNKHIKEIDLEKWLKKFKLHNEILLTKYLEKFSFSKNGDKRTDITKIINKELKLAQRLAVAMKRTRNLGDVRTISNKIKGEVNLVTYSFPCQDLSIASMGRGTGFSKNGENRSSLLWKISDVLNSFKEEDRPEFLLMENVPNMLSPKNRFNYDEWIIFLEEIGYQTITKIFDARDYGIPQSRRRVFAVSFNMKKLNISDFEELENNYKKHIEKKKKDRIKICNYENIRTNFLSLGDEHLEEQKECLMKNTPSRNKMIEQNRNLLSEKLKYVGTLTKKQDRNPNTGYIDVDFVKKDYLKQRFITPREAYKFMGFTDENFEETKKDLCEFTKDKYYSQAGNSIVVNVLEVIFKFIIGVWDEKNR